MSSNTPNQPPSSEDRRAYYRVNVVLPIRIQRETDSTEGDFIERSVNISGGGIGVTVNVSYNPHEVLSLTLLFPDQVVLKTSIEVLRVDAIQYPADTYRLHACFVRMNNKDRELLIRYIMRFQRDHLQEHYLA